MIENIKQAILAVIPDAQVEVNDSQNDGLHFDATVLSSTFEGISLVKQHQIVMKALQEAFDEQTVHALKLKTGLPE